MTVKAGDKVRFENEPLSNGGTVSWTSLVVKVEDGIAYVRHPERASNFPFSPVKAKGLYKYQASRLRKVE